MPYNLPNLPIPIPYPYPAPAPGPAPSPAPSPAPGPPNNSKFNYLKDEISYLFEVNAIEEKLPSILDDFKKYYVFYNKNPTYSEYQTMFENIKSNLNSISSELFKMMNSVQQNINSISKNFTELNKVISYEKIKNKRLKDIYDKINNNYNGSKLMISEYKQIYNEKFMNNVFILLGIIVNGIIIAKVFGKNNKITSVSAQK